VLTPGKKFCAQCGHPTEVKPTATPIEMAIVEPAAPPATRDAVADLQETISVSSEAEKEEPPALEPALGSVSSETTSEPDLTHLTAGQQPSEAVSISEPDVTPAQTPILTPAPAPAAALAPQGSQAHSKAKLGLAIGIAAALVIAAAGGAWAWYAHSHHKAPATAQVAPVPQQTPATPMQSTESTPAVPEQPKPGPGVAAPQTPSAPQSQTDSIPKPIPTPPPPAVHPEPNQQTQQPATPAAPVVTPQLPPPQPAAPRSATLRYQGPPVPQNGKVVFDNLPKARLKFTFDHQAWSLTIKINPDGTKRVTMISLKPGYQSNCDLEWEVVE
jgi:hypothetical protein